MGFTLLLWKAPQVGTADDADRLFRPYIDEGDETGFEPSADASAMRDSLRPHYPPGAKWSAEPVGKSDRVLALEFPSGVDGRTIDHVCDLAREHDLFIYDPQGPELYDPVGPKPDDAVPPADRATWLKLAFMLAAFAIMTWGATRMPIGWARWPLVAVGAFLTAATLFVGIATLFARRGRNATDDRA